MATEAAIAPRATSTGEAAVARASGWLSGHRRILAHALPYWPAVALAFLPSFAVQPLHFDFAAGLQFGAVASFTVLVP